MSSLNWNTNPFDLVNYTHKGLNTMNIAIVCCYNQHSDQSTVKERMMIVQNTQKAIANAINCLKSYNDSIYVFKPDEIHKVVKQPEFATYVYTPDGELIPK